MADKTLMGQIKRLQGTEVFEQRVYERIAKFVKNEADRATLLRIAREEGEHYKIWQRYTGCEVSPNMHRVRWYVLLARLFGYTFAIKRMESLLYTLSTPQVEAQLDAISAVVPDVREILTQEAVHEKKLIDLMDEEKLRYVGSIVLGLNDALVEFTGALAGWSFAMQSNRLIALAGLITGVAATLSMASSEYLSVRHEGGSNALKSALYTGSAYLITVVILLLPFLLLPDGMYLASLIIMLAAAIAIIALFNYYIAVARTMSFRQKFGEMALVSLSVAAVSFLIGLLVKHFLGVDV